MPIENKMKAALEKVTESASNFMAPKKEEVKKVKK